MCFGCMTTPEEAENSDCKEMFMLGYECHSLICTCSILPQTKMKRLKVFTFKATLRLLDLNTGHFIPKNPVNIQSNQDHFTFLDNPQNLGEGL